MTDGLPAPDAAAVEAGHLVDGLVAEFGADAPLSRVRRELVLRVAAALINTEGDVRTDERDECIDILNDLFPPSHPAYADAREAVVRIRRRDTQP